MKTLKTLFILCLFINQSASLFSQGFKTGTIIFSSGDTLTNILIHTNKKKTNQSQVTYKSGSSDVAQVADPSTVLQYYVDKKNYKLYTNPSGEQVFGRDLGGGLAHVISMTTTDRVPLFYLEKTGEGLIDLPWDGLKSALASALPDYNELSKKSPRVQIVPEAQSVATAVYAYSHKKDPENYEFARATPETWLQFSVMASYEYLTMQFPDGETFPLPDDASGTGFAFGVGFSPRWFFRYGFNVELFLASRRGISNSDLDFNQTLLQLPFMFRLYLNPSNKVVGFVDFGAQAFVNINYQVVRPTSPSSFTETIYTAQGGGLGLGGGVGLEFRNSPISAYQLRLRYLPSSHKHRNVDAIFTGAQNSAPEMLMRAFRVSLGYAF